MPHQIEAPTSATQTLTRPAREVAAGALRHAGLQVQPEQVISQPEASLLGAGELTAILNDARGTLYEVGVSTGFQKACVEHGIDPFATEKPAYWSAFARYTNDRVADLLKRNTNGTEADIQKKEAHLRALGLLAATPQYVFAKYKLSQFEQAGKKGSDAGQAKEIASRFNGKLRDFVTEFPATKASSLESALLQVVGRAVENRNVRQVSAQLVNETVRGTQHELGFGQLLEAAGYQARPASTAEDLKGTDYVVIGEHGRQLHIDVKASMWKMDPGVDQRPFKQGYGGNITAYSMLRDHDFADTFFVKSDIVSMKAPVVADMLRQMQSVA